ncbi:uncharacterized protein LOC141860591 isoform X2 [Acropora palmata]|uniref:uncharacterized protein LOC141860591 isoform X2 n=1 Tax=Acropora palmata TaxID=6131 RepID=UPI003DA1BDF3
MLQKRGRLIRTQVPSLRTRMNRALGMRIRQPLRCCCFGGVSTILLRKKTYGRRTLLCTPVLLEIKPELDGSLQVTVPLYRVLRPRSKLNHRTKTHRL